MSIFSNLYSNEEKIHWGYCSCNERFPTKPTNFFGIKTRLGIIILMSSNLKSNTLIFLIFFLGTFAGIFTYSYFSERQNEVVAIESKPRTSIFSREKVEETSKTILIFGDMMLDRNVANRMDQLGYDYPFLNIKDMLLESDIVVANLEGVFTSNPSISREDRTQLQFTFDKKLIPTLVEYNFSILSQANNHTSDFGVEGARESKELLAHNNILTFGDFFNRNDDVVVKDGVAFIGFNEFSYSYKDRVLNLISKYKTDGNKVIVMPHWGIEYVEISNITQQTLAKEFIDSGADIVVGAHPHVVQEIEIYNGKPIFYSLGNFVFDQDFSKATTEGLGIRIVFVDNDIRLNLIPFNIIKSQVSLKVGEEYREFLNNLSSKSSEEIRGEIIKGTVEVRSPSTSRK